MVINTVISYQLEFRLKVKLIFSIVVPVRVLGSPAESHRPLGVYKLIERTARGVAPGLHSDGS
ncbi:MAG: hypothetical protein ACRDEA_15235, partial [Microcystaceae cyanobacterium]